MSGETTSPKVRLQADLPKELRDEVQALYKVAKAAAISGKYKHVKVYDYQLVLGDQTFLPSELEMLPFDLRPSTLAAPRSDTALVFFTKYAIFSNHHTSMFSIKGEAFKTMEQFLALRRAQLSGNQTQSKKLLKPLNRYKPNISCQP